MRNLPELKQQLDFVFDLQRVGHFVLTGFYLNEVDLELCRGILRVDSPRTGAFGRYRRVPVYSLAIKPIPSDKSSDCHSDIFFTYVEVDHVD